MSYHVTIYGALWATSKENIAINPVNGTVSQNTLPCVVRISCVDEPIFHRYHQTMPFLRSDSVRCSSKSLKRFSCRSDFSWGKNAVKWHKIQWKRSMLYPTVSFLIYHSSFSFDEYLVSSVIRICTVLLFLLI